MAEWFKTNRLSLNVKKTSYITFYSPNKTILDSGNKLFIEGIATEQVSSTKFLGIYIDKCLTWKEHVKIIASKIAKNLGTLRKIAYLLLSKILINPHYTLVNPYFLIYGNIVWAYTYYTCNKCLILLQKRAIRDKYYNHTSKRFQELGIMKFDCINRYLIGHFLFKYFNNLLPPVFINFFTKTIDVHEHYTRAFDSVCSH